MIGAQQKIHPSRNWYIIGVVLFFMGTIGAPGWFIVTLVSGFTSGEYFLAPCTQTFTLDDPGKYVLWHASKIFFQGRNYSSPPELPDGVIIKVVNNETKEGLTLKSSYGSTESSGHNKKVSVCSFLAETSGKYTIEISNLSSSQVFMLRKSQTKRVLLALLKCGLIGLIGGIGGTIVVIVVAVKRHKVYKNLEN
jgi:hypothetical protein